MVNVYLAAHIYAFKCTHIISSHRVGEIVFLFGYVSKLIQGRWVDGSENICVGRYAILSCVIENVTLIIFYDCFVGSYISCVLHGKTLPPSLYIIKGWHETITGLINVLLRIFKDSCLYIYMRVKSIDLIAIYLDYLFLYAQV